MDTFSTPTQGRVAENLLHAKNQTFVFAPGNPQLLKLVN